MQTTPSKKYWAFISYSSKDKKWGQWLHSRLESYPIPKEFQGTELFDGAILGKNLRPVFRDRDELSGSSDLGPAILNALQESRYLIVLCSKNSAKSEWVNKEIEDFKKLHGEKNILALILDGEPNATTINALSNDQDCFPPALRYPAEPLAGDLRKEGDGKERGFLKVLSGIAQLDFDTLYRRHERAQRKKRITLGSIAAIIIASLTALSLFALSQKEIAQQQEKKAKENEAQALASEAIAKEKTIAERAAKQKTEEELYFSSIANATSSLSEGSPLSTIRALAASPSKLRSWEWHLLADLTSFAPIEISPTLINSLDEGPLKNSGLLQAAKNLINSQATNQPTFQSNGLTAYSFSSTRSGQPFFIARKPWQPSLFSASTDSYQDIHSVWISPDKSLALVYSSPLRLETHQITVLNSDTTHNSLHLIPTHNHDTFLPYEHTTSIEELNTEKESPPETSPLNLQDTFQIKSYGKNILTASSQSIEGNATSGIPTPEEIDKFKILETTEEQFSNTAPYTAWLSLTESERKNLAPWFHQTQPLVDDEDLLNPYRTHLDVDFTQSDLPLLSVSHDGIVSITPLKNPTKSRTLKLTNDRAKEIWKSITNHSPTAYDIGGLFTQDGSKFLLAPYTEDQANIIDTKALKALNTIKGAALGGADVHMAANDWTARSGSPVWKISPKSNYVSLSAYDAPSSINHLGVAEIKTGNLIYSEAYTRLIAVDWDQSESLFAVYDAQRSNIELYTWPNRKSILSTYFPSGTQGSDLIQEFPNAPDRILVGNTLFRKSDFHPICTFKDDPTFASDGSWAAFLPNSKTESAELNNDRRNWARIRIVFPKKITPSLADKTRQWQLQVINKTRNPSATTPTPLPPERTEKEAEKRRTEIDTHLEALTKKLKTTTTPEELRIKTALELAKSPHTDPDTKTIAAFILSQEKQHAKIATNTYHEIKFKSSNEIQLALTALFLNLPEDAHQHLIESIPSEHQENKNNIPNFTQLLLIITSQQTNRPKDAKYAYNQILTANPAFKDPNYINTLDLPALLKSSFIIAVKNIQETTP